MIDPGKLEYYTLAAWCRGFASGLEQPKNDTLIYKLKRASKLLDAVWDEYAEKEGLK